MATYAKTQHFRPHLNVSEIRLYLVTAFDQVAVLTVLASPTQAPSKKHSPDICTVGVSFQTLGSQRGAVWGESDLCSHTPEAGSEVH